jgi:hypothetical protein
MDAAVSSLLRNWSTAAASIWVGMPSADANPEGTTSWFAQPGRHLGHELIAAGLLILAGVTDRDQLQEAVRVGFERGRRSLQTPVGQLVPGAAGARVLQRDRPLPGDDDDAVRVGAHSPGGREPAAQHLTESGVAPRVAVADVFVEQADRDVLQEVTSGDQNKARDMVTEATQDIARIIKT